MATVETATFDYTSPHCDLDLKDSKPIFLRNTPAHDDTKFVKKNQKKYPVSKNITGQTFINFQLKYIKSLEIDVQSNNLQP